MNDAEPDILRAKVLDEFASIAAYPDGSPELAQFNQRLKSRIADRRDPVEAREFAAGLRLSRRHSRGLDYAALSAESASPDFENR